MSVSITVQLREGTALWIPPTRAGAEGRWVFRKNGATRTSPLPARLLRQIGAA